MFDFESFDRDSLIFGRTCRPYDPKTSAAKRLLQPIVCEDDWKRVVNDTGFPVAEEGTRHSSRSSVVDSQKNTSVYAKHMIVQLSVLLEKRVPVFCRQPSMSSLVHHDATSSHVHTEELSISSTSFSSTSKKSNTNPTTPCKIPSPLTSHYRFPARNIQFTLYEPLIKDPSKGNAIVPCGTRQKDFEYPLEFFIEKKKSILLIVVFCMTTIVMMIL